MQSEHTDKDTQSGASPPGDLRFPIVFVFFLWISLDFYKGRISPNTPGSMNRLFSDFFEKNKGSFRGCFRLFGGDFGGVLTRN